MEFKTLVYSGEHHDDTKKVRLALELRVTLGSTGSIASVHFFRVVKGGHETRGSTEEFGWDIKRPMPTLARGVTPMEPIVATVESEDQPGATQNTVRLQITLRQPLPDVPSDLAATLDLRQPAAKKHARPKLHPFTSAA